MKPERIVDNLVNLMVSVLVISVIWQALEQMIYDEIQARAVDSMISILWICLAVRAYRAGLKDGLEA